MGLLPDTPPEGLDSPLTVRAIRAMARSQVALFRLTNGRIGSRWRIGAGFRKPVPTALWPRLVELYADFDRYAAWTDREIPVVVLGLGARSTRARRSAAHRRKRVRVGRRFAEAY